MNKLDIYHQYARSLTSFSDESWP